jgi:hypothetical protein
VVAHGHVRFRAGVDLVLDPDPAALRAAVEALQVLGYRPRAPVPFEDFADAGERRAWARDQGMTVFSASSPAHPATEIDLFLEPPHPFEGAYSRAARLEWLEETQRVIERMRAAGGSGPGTPPR